MRKIKFTLDPQSIQRAIDDLATYKTEVREKISMLIQALTDYGVEYAKAEIVQVGANYTGATLSSIEGYYSPTTGVGIIKAGAWWAAYIEFGTGVVGAQNPHPDPKDWQYDINSHGEEGWLYYNDRDGKFHWTKGVASKPFMYNTGKELEKECGRIAREVFHK